MLKHVQVSPQRSRADSVSISSTASLCSLTEPLHSRAPSYSSLSENSGQTPIKVYAKCLRSDIEYKTLSVTMQTTSREVVAMLLSKFRMKHRDPRLFYLTMEVAVKRAGVRTTLTLSEDARPAALQTCHPKGYSKFSLQTCRGGLIRIYDSALMSSSQYKSLLISEKTTADELLALLLSCYNSKEKVEQFSLYEVCESQEYQRKLHPDDLPLRVQQAWQGGAYKCHFLVRRNPDYCPFGKRKQMLWSQDFQLPTKQLPRFSTMQQTLQSFSSLSLSNPTEEKKSNSDNLLNVSDTALMHKHKNKSIDNILDENSEKWGNYVNFKCESMKPLVTEKYQACSCESKSFVGHCKSCDDVKSPVNGNLISSKSCHQIGYYSPVYKYPSIGNYNNTDRYSTKSFDTTSISSIENDEVISSTPNHSPNSFSYPDSGPASLCSSNSYLSTKPPPLAAPRKKLPNSFADYENYFYI